MLQKCKLQWAVKGNEWKGNALGYNTHNNNMLKYCSKIMDITDEADIALSIVPADHFTPVYGKKNILFSMFEFLDLPETYITNLNRADAIVVPCKFCKDLFKRYTSAPVEVCWEGVDKRYQFYQRRFPRLDSGEKFRFLWVGAPNPRKGYLQILEAVKVIEKTPYMEMYIKTTTSSPGWKDIFKTLWRRKGDIFRGRNGEEERVAFLNMAKRRFMKWLRPALVPNTLKAYGKYKNIIVDTRFLPFNELIDLYNSAHCFVLPSCGEGWGLTLSEAMATGAPCIASSHTGSADFFDDYVGYDLKYTEVKQKLKNYKLDTRGYLPDVKDMILKMLYVFAHYQEALKKGKRASERMRTKFTWEKSAQRLDDLVRRWQ